MADIERRPAVLAVQVVRVDRKVQASLPVRIVLGVAQTVIAKETDRPAKPIVEADEDLILVEVATGFILVNVANVAKRTNSQGISSRDTPRQRRVDVSVANHMLNLKYKDPGKHCEPVRQLTLDLQASSVDSGRSQIGRDAISNLTRSSRTSQ